MEGWRDGGGGGGMLTVPPSVLFPSRAASVCVGLQQGIMGVGVWRGGV